MHPTYKHLEDQIRLAGLTLGQWAQLAACALAAFLLAKTLPLPGSWPISIAITVAGMPAAASIAMLQQDLDLALLARAALVERRGARIYRAGATEAGLVSHRRHHASDWTPGDWGQLWD